MNHLLDSEIDSNILNLFVGEMVLGGISRSYRS